MAAPHEDDWGSWRANSWRSNRWTNEGQLPDDNGLSALEAKLDDLQSRLELLEDVDGGHQHDINELNLRVQLQLSELCESHRAISQAFATIETKFSDEFASFVSKTPAGGCTPFSGEGHQLGESSQGKFHQQDQEMKHVFTRLELLENNEQKHEKEHQ